MDVDLVYDRTELAVDETVQATATVRLNAPAAAQMLLVDLALPPGFDLVRSDWEALQDAGALGRYDVLPGRVRAYLSNVQPGEVVVLPYRLRARLVVNVETGPSRAFDFYTPSTRDDAPPQRIIVRLAR
jgi:uncharacterized protein YfaS (alpha-2-macroglobulin family)